jgi:hypothetical protein
VVDKILQTANDPNSKFYALQILDEAVNVSEFSLNKNFAHLLMIL